MKPAATPAFDPHWRIWFREPYGFWTNGGTCPTYHDAQAAIAAFRMRGYETKPEYLGRYIGANQQSA